MGNTVTLRFTMIPPSANHAYANVTGRGRVATKALRTWKKDGGWAIALQKTGTFSGDVDIEIKVRRGHRQKRADIDNRTKAMLDLLVAHHVIKDDHFVRSVKTSWMDSDAVDACIVTISDV